MTQSIRTLMTDLIDYAGLFPPAKLEMPAAVEEYARHRRGEYEWMLGRFICPVSRLDEFAAQAAPLMPGTFATSGYREHADIQEPWMVSAIIDGPLDDDLDRVYHFNRRHSKEDHGLARIDLLEIKAPDPSFVDDALDVIPEDIFPFFEFPPPDKLPGADCRGFVAALAGNSSGAKLRMGGLTADAFPTCDYVAKFLKACVDADVPFKATAGLHHPVRHFSHAVKSEMHGFFNLFITAGLLEAGKIDEARAVEVLRDQEAGNFLFNNDTAGWKDQRLTVAQVAKVREAFALSYGSCSFDEPIDDLKGMGLL